MVVWLLAACASTAGKQLPFNSPRKGVVLEVGFEADRVEGEDEEMGYTLIAFIWGEAGAEKERVILDKFLGLCGEVPPAPDQEILDLQCWHAGQGADYYVAWRGESLVVERRYTWEEVGEGEEAPMEVLHKVKVAPGTLIRALTR